MDRKESLSKFLKETEKVYGAGAVMLGNQKPTHCDVIPTGSLKIDMALGVGGFPKGRITEVFGAESSGKTTLMLQTAANCQKAGGKVLMVDVESSLDPSYATALGLNLDDLIISQPGLAEDALGIIKTALMMQAFDMIILDSIAAMTPRAVVDGEPGDSHMAIVARLLSRNLSMLHRAAVESNTCLAFVNQIRDNIGVMYGEKTTTVGGRAMKFYASMRIQVSRSTLNKDGEEVIGNKVKVKVVKNKLAPPYKECEAEILYGQGFSKTSELVDIGSDMGIVEKAGSWYSYEGERIGQGRDNAVEFLTQNPKTADEIEGKIRAALEGEDVEQSA